MQKTTHNLTNLYFALTKLGVFFVLSWHWTLQTFVAWVAEPT